MNGSKVTGRAVRFFVTALLLALPGAAVASDEGQVAAARVSEASYRYFLDDMLYTHAGDDRGFGPEHDLAQANIAFLMESFGLTVTLEPVVWGQTYYNVVGTKLGSTYPDQEYIIGAHYDSVNNPGADDNGSGVALVLEAARVLSDCDSDHTIRFIAFDREEQGLHGSDAYVQDHIADDILGMISADMVAYNTRADSVDIYGRSASNPIKYALQDAVATYGEGLSSVMYGGMDASDHAPFEWEGFQACLLIEDWGNPFYHTQNDNVDMPGYIDYAYAAKITRIVVGFLVDQAGVSVELPSGDFDGDGDVDYDDYDQFGICFTGPDPADPIGAECFHGDFDVDGDVDCFDWDRFVLEWTEPAGPPDLAQCLVYDPLAAPWPDDAQKNRYISFEPNNNGISVAFEFELTDSTYFPDSVGVFGWVGQPDGNGIARESPGPFFTDAWPPVVHLGDCVIVPVATYEVRATKDGIYFSDTLEISTITEPVSRWWADVVGGNEGGQWTPPGGFVNMTDVQALIITFEGTAVTVPLTWADIEGEVPDGLVDMADAQMAVLAFEGSEYPYSAPEDCP